jgi:cytochrome c-type biogenesis protein CcmF
MRNTRRYGGYVVHFGMVLIFIGLAGQAFTAELETELKPGQSATLRNYRFDLTDIKADDNANFTGLTAVLDVYKNGEKIATMNPERRFYKASQQPVSVVNIRQRLNEDLYVVFLGPGADNQAAGLHVYINPLVAWIWIGGFINIFGTLLALIPARGVHESSRRAAQFAVPEAVRA